MGYAPFLIPALGPSNAAASLLFPPLPSSWREDREGRNIQPKLRIGRLRGGLDGGSDSHPLTFTPGGEGGFPFLIPLLPENGLKISRNPGG